MADVIAIYISVVDVKTTEADVIACFILFNYWLMLLPIFLWQMLWPHIIAQCGGRCYCQMARWNSHCRGGGY